MATSLGFIMLAAQAPAGQGTPAQQAIPDAPKPQPTLRNLGTVTPGQGTTSTSNGDSGPNGAVGAPLAPAPAGPAAVSGNDGQPPAAADQGTTLVPAAGEGVNAYRLNVQVNYVDLPFTVKDSKGALVAGLTARDVRVYENNSLQHIAFFTTDAFPLSVALVIDQSMTHDEMTRLNDSLGALQDAFTQFDEVAEFTYNKGPKMVTDFTGGQSARLTQAIELSKGAGRDALMAGSLGGPLASTTVINDQNFDPNTAPVRGNTGMQLNPPREIHTLNDAILAAAKALSRRPIEYRRVIYVISDGKEYGSVAHTKDVIRYLQANRIQVDVTLVGDSSLPVVGYLDRFHLPLMMRDDVLTAYWQATGGVVDAEFRTGAIERSFAKIAGEVRNQYTLGYYTHEPFIDGKYRQVELRVVGHGNDLNIIAKKGYFPSAMEMRPPVASGQ